MKKTETRRIPVVHFLIMENVLRVHVCLCLSLSGHCGYINVIAFSADLPSARSIVRLSGNRG